MIIDLITYGLLKALSWILNWIPPLPDWLIDASYNVIDFCETLAEYASPIIGYLPMDVIRPMIGWTITAVMLLWVAGIIHRFVAWIIPNEPKGRS